MPDSIGLLQPQTYLCERNYSEHDIDLIAFAFNFVSSLFDFTLQLSQTCYFRPHKLHLLVVQGQILDPSASMAAEIGPHELRFKLIVPDDGFKPCSFTAC